MTMKAIRGFLLLALAWHVTACAPSQPDVRYPAFVRVDEIPDVFIAGLPGVRAKGLVGADSDSAGGGYRIDLPSSWQGTSGASPDKTLEIFVIDGEQVSQPIGAMPGHARLSIDRVIAKCTEALGLGVGTFALFPAVDPALKTPDAQEAVNPQNLLCRAVRAIKESVPEAYVVTDVALDPYSSMGHDGLVADGVVVNDETVDVLAEMAVVHAKAGADMVAVIHGVFGQSHMFPRAVNLLPLLNLKPYRGPTFPIEDFMDAFDAHRTNKYVRVLVKC